MREQVKRFATLLVVLFALIAVNCFAQFTASIQGSVQDKSGAAIAKATVDLLNSDTQVSQQTTSDNAGVYRFASLAPGPYVVSATAPSFAPAKVSVTLTGAENRNVPVTLAVGQVSTSVEVTSQAPLVDTADSRNQETLDQTALVNLPLASRDPVMLITLAPGVTGFAGTSSSQGTTTAITNFNPENFFQASANGRGQNGNAYIVDGLDVTSSIRPGVLNLTPNVDSLSEVTVQVNTYSVDYGRASSIQTLMSSKPGTDQYHGFASEYYTYEGLQSRGEFGVAQSQKLAPYHTNNMSFGIGGPVIPKHRFFFFFSYEPYLSLLSNGQSLQTFEDPAFVAFAQQVMPNSPEVQLFTKYPASSATFRNVFQTAQQAFGSQNIAANTGCATPSTDNIPCATAVIDQGNFNSSSPENAKQYNIRVDKYFDKDRIYGLFYRNTINSGAPAVRPAFNTTNDDYIFSIQGNETHTFTTNTLNEAFIGYNRIEGANSQTGLFTVPIVSVTNLGVGWGVGFAQGTYIQHSDHWRDVLTHIRGGHSFKFGYEGWHGDDLAYFAGAIGQPNIHFNSMIDLINNNPYEENNLSYDPVTGQPKAYNYGYQQFTFGMFAEDSWKATKRLTINYGIRYDNGGNTNTALAGTVLANFHPATASTFAESIANGVMTKQSNVFAHDLNWIFSPRVGLAYDLLGDSKWVLRGGVGLYHDYFTLGNSENGLAGNPPGPIKPNFFNNGSTAPPIFSYGTQNKYPFGFTYPAFVGSPLDAKGGIVGSQAGVGGVDPNLGAPRTENWSVTLEHQITRDMVASVGYVGSHSGNLITDGGNVNSTSYGNDVNAFSGDLLQHPVFGASGNYTGSGAQTRLNTSFGSINYATNGPTSNYYAVVVAVKGRFAKRGFVTASYSRSRSMDDWQNYPQAFPYTQYYALSPWDVPNRVSLGWSYELPGANLSNSVLRRVAGGWTLSGITILQSGTPFSVYNGAALAINPVGTSGVPITSANYAAELAAGDLQFAPGSGDYNADGNNYDYPNVSSYTQKTSRSDYESGHGIFAACPGAVLPCGDFTLPAVGGLGNEKPDQFRNAGYANTDFTIKKVTQITERVNLEFRFDAFNVFNRVNLQAVDANLQDGGFGTTSSTYAPRNMLLGVRVNF